MAFTKTALTNDTWTLVGNNVTNITFQNVGDLPLYINFSATNTAPSDTVGLLYGPTQGEMKKDVTELTTVSTPNYVFARAKSEQAHIIVETA